MIAHNCPIDVANLNENTSIWNIYKMKGFATDKVSLLFDTKD